MRSIELANVTEVAVASLAGLGDERRRVLMQRLVTLLHGYAKEVRLTHEELAQATPATS